MNINNALLFGFCLFSSSTIFSEASPPDGFKTLFNGVDLEGWWGAKTEDPEKWMSLSQEQFKAKWLASKQDVKKHWRVENGELVNDGNGGLDRIILPIHGYGLWSTLYGFVALESDANTIVGLGFYEHGETPGLGGEVDNPSWKAKWSGKLAYKDGDVAITVLKGAVNPASADAQWQVDGLSGATLTTKGVSNLVQYWLGEDGFAPLLGNLRGGNA